MPPYNYTSLSPLDFEDLARDLLQAEWNVALEAFTAGRDDGIDLRYATAGDNSVVIQCKHYAASGYRRLFTHLKDVERPKLERLRPQRYVIVTSAGLTPANKAAIAKVLHPFVVNSNDVIGRNDLDGLLSRHPDVERANFKLWLASAVVFERVLHNAELCHTEFEVSRIRRKLRLFVQSDAFPRAKEILEQRRVVVISGMPGIGKTTLAEVLLYSYLSEGYEPVVIQADIVEGRKFFKPGAKRVFYFDDFLGQAFLGDRSDYLSRNQDAALVDFIQMVCQSSHAHFILTTREHLLSSALQASERLSHSHVLDHHCILELRDYSRRHRARILYNHLSVSDLPLPFKAATLEGDFFLTVVDHENFNPRLIEWLSSFPRLRGIDSSGYREHIEKLLDSPEKIWGHAYRSQISDAARNVLLALYTLGSWATDIVDLEPAFSSLHRFSASHFHHRVSPGDYRRALQELDGAFLSYGPGGASFLNPSVREFIASVICSDQEIVKVCIESAVRFKQIVNLQELADARQDTALAELLAPDHGLVHKTLSTLAVGPSMRWEKGPNGSRGYAIDTSEEGRILFMVEIAERHHAAQLSALASTVAHALIKTWEHHVPDFMAVVRLLGQLQEKTWFLANGGRSLYRQLLDGMFDHLSFAFAHDWLALLSLPQSSVDWPSSDDQRLRASFASYLDDGVGDERSNCTTLDELRGLRESLSELDSKFGIDVARHLERLCEDIDERDDSSNGLVGDRSPVMRATRASDPPMTDDDVRDLFSTLIDEGSEGPGEA